MKKLLSVMMIAAFLATACCNSSDEPVKVILETDLGNDVDDALALGLAYNYIDSGKMDLLGICINKEGTAPAELADILNCYYGHPEIPIGVIRNGAFCETDAINYAKAVVNMRNEDGSMPFERSITDYDALPQAHELYRKILSSQKDHSVVIVSVGFSTNLLRLLETEPDEYSPLSGRELVEKKVKLLVTMAGAFENPAIHEYNVVKDIPAAKAVFEQWPTPLVTSPFELGIQALYPAASIESDFGEELNPIVEAYRSYLPMPYDRPTWELTSLLYAVEGGDMFNISENGTMEVTPEGSTIFTPNPDGDRRYLSVDANQAKAIVERFVELIPAAGRTE